MIHLTNLPFSSLPKNSQNSPEFQEEQRSPVINYFFLRNVGCTPKLTKEVKYCTTDRRNK